MLQKEREKFLLHLLVSIERRVHTSLFLSTDDHGISEIAVNTEDTVESLQVVVNTKDTSEVVVNKEDTEISKKTTYYKKEI